MQCISTALSPVVDDRLSDRTVEIQSKKDHDLHCGFLEVSLFSKSPYSPVSLPSANLLTRRTSLTSTFLSQTVPSENVD